MPITLEKLIDEIHPENTILFFGAGSSIPSGAPSTEELTKYIGERFKIEFDDFTLQEVAGLAEDDYNRKKLVKCIREKVLGLKPTGGLLNLPLLKWHSIYTTNYDTLIEQCYKRRELAIQSYDSSFDFDEINPDAVTKLFKLHGTIEKDVADGHKSRIIITEKDYDQTYDYREKLYKTFENSIGQASLVIIGYSLSDSHIREIVNKAIAAGNSSHSGGNIYLLLFQKDEQRAKLFEKRGIQIAFGGIDDFFSGLSQKSEFETKSVDDATDPLDICPRLRPNTIDVKHQVSQIAPDVAAMYNGQPATYSDISARYTFDRDMAEKLKDVLSEGEGNFAILLGASGVGKTSAVRQALLKLNATDAYCWEHRADSPFHALDWIKVSQFLSERSKKGYLFIDNSHEYLREINNLADKIGSQSESALKLVLVSSRNQWNPRVKSPALLKNSSIHLLSTLSEVEIDRLIKLVESEGEISKLTEESFLGFSRVEKQRRLALRCEADMFVCLKNIFSSEKFDDIILREYGELEERYQEVYKLVAAMEISGVKVHRQMIIRALGIPADSINSVLENLTDIISEYTVNKREGIFGWACRHQVIAEIVAKYKFGDLDDFLSLFNTVIDNIVPTYEIEIRTLIQLCNFSSGIARIPDKHRQNVLLRRIISVAPGQRVPRHRLIRNLIDLKQFDKADTEIRIFEKDFRVDGPTYRYKILLKLARAETTVGLMHEDRLRIIYDACSLAEAGVKKYANNKNILGTYCEVGISLFKMNKDLSVFEDAMSHLKRAEERLGDPDVTTRIRHFERRISGFEGSINEFSEWE